MFGQLEASHVLWKKIELFLAIMGTGDEVAPLKQVPKKDLIMQ